ncbi:MAG: ACP S-malonyltransferase [Candidatus Abyssubacteria bacterium]
MARTAWIFPGQGSQYVGMGKALYECNEDVRSVFDRAEQLLGIPLRQFTFEGPEETLKQTQYAQLAIFVFSVALSKVLGSMGLAPDMVAGHSLGEYSALTASGALTFDDALCLVRDRANSMQHACETNPGTMCAILGLDEHAVKEVCSGITDGIVDLANVNSPTQIVISGEHEAVRTAADEAKRRGAKRTVPLHVSGAFHSRLMRPAAERFEPSVTAVSISRPASSFFPNVSAVLTEDPWQIRDNLLAQVCSPVRWQSTIERMCGLGADTFIEVGPGNVLTGLLKRIDGAAVGLTTDAPDSLEIIARTY